MIMIAVVVTKTSMAQDDNDSCGGNVKTKPSTAQDDYDSHGSNVKRKSSTAQDNNDSCGGNKKGKPAWLKMIMIAVMVTRNKTQHGSR